MDPRQNGARLLLRGDLALVGENDQRRQRTRHGKSLWLDHLNLGNRAIFA